jgi:carbon monoxide dehydrogenase subunit G
MTAFDVSTYHHSDSITIERPPADVYAIVSDVTRVGELSPVCQTCTWDDPSQAGHAGAWFTGHNAIGELTWDTHCQVVAAEPGREFTFVNHGRDGDAELVRWSYAFDTRGDATLTTESWQVLPAYPDMVRAGADDPNIDVAARLDGMAQMARDGIKDTLANLKRLAEA